MQNKLEGSVYDDVSHILISVSASEKHRFFFLHRDKFLECVRLVARLDHPNLANVVGVCTRDQPVCVLTEYTEYGDLRQFLANHSARLTAPDQTGTARYKGLVCIRVKPTIEQQQPLLFILVGFHFGRPGLYKKERDAALIMRV